MDQDQDQCNMDNCSLRRKKKYMQSVSSLKRSLHSFESLL